MATTHNTTVQNQWWPWQQLAAYFKMANPSVSLQMAVGVLRLHWGIAQLGLSSQAWPSTGLNIVAAVLQFT